MSQAFTVFLPGVKTTTPGNSRRHWRVEWKEGKLARNLARLSLNRDLLPKFPVKVTITRHSPGKCDKHNLGGALKHVIDGVADAYGVDDGHDGWDFQFDQVKCKRGKGGVEIRIESK